MKLPKARTEHIVVQDINNEVLVYDLKSNEAFCLNETSADIYRACNGEKTFAELEKSHKFQPELIHFALKQLYEKNLLEGEDGNYFAGLSRREILRRVGFATMIALPVISSLAAPSAATAASNACVGAGTFAPGQPNFFGCIGICTGTGTDGCTPATCNCNGSTGSNAACCSGISTTGVCDGNGTCNCVCSPPTTIRVAARGFSGALPTKLD